jgi:tRNA(fMet)-specific endonuclease VapC
VKYLLDTNTVSYYLRGIPATVARVQGQAPSALAISAVSAMALAYGGEQRRSKTLTAAVHGILSGVQVLPFDNDAALRAGVIRAAMERVGVVLSLADGQIAGHAVALGPTLVSADAAFRRVRGMTVRDWSA